MNNEKKGFTLVELLAVIVILAIILVIAVPQIMSVIEDAKKATLESTVKMIASAAEKAKVQNVVLGKEAEEITCASVTKINDVDYESCIVTFENNTAKVTIVGKGKFEGLNVCNGTKTTATSTEDGCSGSTGSSSPYALSALATTSDEVAGVAACAAKGSICTNGANGTEPTMFAIKVNDTDVYNFYVISDDGNEVTLIMDSNLGPTVAWGRYETGPLAAVEELKTRTAGWSNIPERDYSVDGLVTTSLTDTIMRARMITYDETTSKLGCGQAVESAIDTGCPSYLTANLGLSYGYWTSTGFNNRYAYRVGPVKEMSADQSIQKNGYFGLRPVITLEK